MRVCMHVQYVCTSTSSVDSGLFRCGVHFFFSLARRAILFDFVVATGRNFFTLGSAIHLSPTSQFFCFFAHGCTILFSFVAITGR